jgi:ribosomal protein L19
LFEVTPQNYFQFRVPKFQGIEVNKKGAIRRMKISNARDRSQLEQTQQFPDALMGIECDLLSE